MNGADDLPMIVQPQAFGGKNLGRLAGTAASAGIDKPLPMDQWGEPATIMPDLGGKEVSPSVERSALSVRQAPLAFPSL